MGLDNSNKMSSYFSAKKAINHIPDVVCSDAASKELVIGLLVLRISSFL